MAEQSLIDVLNIWDKAVTVYEEGKWRAAIEKFSEMSSPSSRIIFNIGCCHLNLATHCEVHRNRTLHYEEAIEVFNQCLEKDRHLVIAFIQRAMCQYYLQRYPKVIEDLNAALRLIGERSYINYQPIGLSHKVTLEDLSHNLFVTKSVTGNLTMSVGNHTKFNPNIATPQLNKKLDWIPVPESAIFHPDRTMLANVAKRDYLGTAVVLTESADTTMDITQPNVRKLSKASNLPKSAANNTLVLVNPQQLQELRREMPSVPPPRLIQSRTAPTLVQASIVDVTKYRLAPPPDRAQKALAIAAGTLFNSRSKKIDQQQQQQQKQQQQQQQQQTTGLLNWPAVDVADSSRRTVVGRRSHSPKNDPWTRPPRDQTLSELERELQKRKPKTV